MEKELALNYEQYERTNFNFPGNEQLYLMKNFDLEELNDTLSRTINKLFVKSEVANKLNEHINTWLRDSLFVINNFQTGSALFDKMNLQDQKFPTEYYTTVPITIYHEKSNRSFQTVNQFYTASVNGHDLDLSIILGNGKTLLEEGEYRIETTGEYVPHSINVYGNTLKSNLRYNRNLVFIDWFITLTSDYYFDRPLAIKISDSTIYYESNWKGKLIN